MNAVEKRYLSQEAEMQLTALKTISIWKNIAIAISTLGAAAVYAAMAGASHNLFLGILGVVITLAGLGGAAVLNLGLKNGRRNVEKMLSVLERGSAS